MKNSPKDRLLIAAFLIILVVFGALAIRKHLVSRSTTQAVVPAVPATPESKPMREVLLYFGTPDGRLLPEAREIEDCQAEENCVRATVQALIDGPIGDLVPIFPPPVVLHGVNLRDNTAELDFSRELISAHPGGSISELLTIYGLADSVAVNFPHIRQVRILVEGKPVETLKGHFGLLEPVKADFTYTRPAEEGGAAGIQTERTAPSGEGGKRP